MLSVIEALFGLYKHIINIDLHGFAQQWLEYLSDECLKHSGYTHVGLTFLASFYI